MAMSGASDVLVVGEKNCIACKQCLPLTAFYRDAARADGRTRYCIICSRAKVALWKVENPEKYAKNRAAHYKRDPKRHLNYVAKWQRENPEKHLASNQKYRDKMTVTPKPPASAIKACKSCEARLPLDQFRVFTSAKDGRTTRCIACLSHDYRLKNYGLSPQQFDQMWQDQEGRCVICTEVLLPYGKGGCTIDHNHDTGEVRGILCSNCNVAIGNLRDNPTSCERAAAYLRGHAKCL